MQDPDCILDQHVHPLSEGKLESQFRVYVWVQKVPEIGNTLGTSVPQWERKAAGRSSYQSLYPLQAPQPCLSVRAQEAAASA